MRNRSRVGALALMCLVLVALTAGLASASTLTGIPGRLADTLDVSDTTAELIISVAILVAVALALAAARVPVIALLIVILAVMGLLTVLGWVDTWLMILAALLTVGMFAGIMSTTFGGGGEN